MWIAIIGVLFVLCALVVTEPVWGGTRASAALTAVTNLLAVVSPVCAVIVYWCDKRECVIVTPKLDSGIFTSGPCFCVEVYNAGSVPVRVDSAILSVKPLNEPGGARDIPLFLKDGHKLKLERADRCRLYVWPRVLKGVPVKVEAREVEVRVAVTLGSGKTVRVEPGEVWPVLKGMLGLVHPLD